MSTQTVLVVDDEPDICSLVKEILEDDGFRVVVAHNGKQANTQFMNYQPQLILLDIWMSDVDGISLLKKWKVEQQIQAAVIMMSGHGTVETAVEATRLGAYDFIEKPLSLVKLQLMVKHALDDAGLRCENQHLHWLSKSNKEQVVGTSGLIRELRSNLQRMAHNDAPVLINGDAGTNKEACAVYMHSMSRRRDQAFLPINVSGLDKTHVEQLLFGDTDTTGAFEQCNGGTLFLKNISDIPLALQTRLLEVMESKTLPDLRGRKPLAIDIRIMAATRIPIEGMVKKGTFCKDLFYLLNVLSVKVPSLQQHCEDIPELVRYYVEYLSGTESLPFRRFSVAAQNCLRRHTWPGNLRELRNTIQHLLIMSNNEVIEVEEVAAVLERGKLTINIEENESSSDPFDLNLPLRDARENFEREYLLRQLERLNWNVSHTADVTGVERTHLYRKLKSLGIKIK